MTTNMNIRPTTECVRDSSESLKQITDNITSRCGYLREDLLSIKQFLFNSPNPLSQKDIQEPTCLVEQLKSALEVINDCIGWCEFIKERLG